ncbi:MAG TPA: response regulator [Thermoanaerobaculia bacterium]|jgi:CheY-like chemotaxis protein|nr:response regulator [Thermoanaerobaculia bacterium]
MSRKILLADDSVTIQKVIELTFMDEDYEVKAVSNGDEALAALPEVRPDFVIADVHMPGANGYEVCRRSKEMRPDVPVLLLVGTFEPFDEGQARAAGADSFLKKPFDSQELLQRVQDLLTSRAGAPPPLPPPLPSRPFDIQEPPPTLELDATPFRPVAAEPDWGAFQLEPEPQPSAPLGATPFLEDESPFVLEDERGAYPVEEPPVLPMGPEGESLFDFGSPASPVNPASAHAHADEPLPALPDIDFGEPLPAASHTPAGFDATWSGEETAPDEHLSLADSALPPTRAYTTPMAASLPAIDHPPIEHPPVERPPLPPTTPLVPPPFSASTPAAAAPSGAFAAPTPPPPPPQVGSVTTNGGPLSDVDVDRIARRMVELMGDKAVRDVAWEIVPDLAEVVIRARLRELESQVESSAE